MNKYTSMLARIVLAASLDEFLDKFTPEDIERYLGLPTDSITDSDAEHRREQAKSDLWCRMRELAETELVKLFDSLYKEA